jgi:hypothetical protein
VQGRFVETLTRAELEATLERRQIAAYACRCQLQAAGIAAERWRVTGESFAQLK